MSVKVDETIGQQVRHFRKRLGINQHELAKRMGFSVAETVSQIERGQREVKAWELAKLARILLVELSDLIEVEAAPAPIILWRAEPDSGREEAEALFLKRCTQYAFLESLAGRKPSDSFPQKQVDPEKLTFPEVTKFAEEIGRVFNLGTKPAAVLEGVLEDSYGVKVWHAPMAEGSAASVLGPFGPAILMNANEAPWRRNYNFAHEVFHLITWRDIPPNLLVARPKLREKVEKLANAFASNLLLPSESLLVEFTARISSGKISYADLVDLARSFIVSTEALAYRLLNLKQIKEETVKELLDDPKFRALDRCSMPACWRPIPGKFPERFVRLGFLAYNKGKLSKTKLASLLDTSIADLNRTLEEYGLGNEAYSTETQVRVA